MHCNAQIQKFMEENLENQLQRYNYSDQSLILADAH